MVRLLVIAATTCAVLVGCGQTVPPGAGHDSPEAALAGFTGTTAGGGVPVLAAMDWIAPSDRGALRDVLGFNDRDNLALTLHSGPVRISGTTYETSERARVDFDGDVGACADGVLPPPDNSTVHRCIAITVAAGGHAALRCVREAGRWYVSFDIGSGGATGGDVTPPPPSTAGHL